MAGNRETFWSKRLWQKIPLGPLAICCASVKLRHNIAACLYDRLRRKYVFLEPSEWQEQKLSSEAKLERLLKHLSENVLKDGQKEVLYIDAADQAQVKPVEKTPYYRARCATCRLG